MQPFWPSKEQFLSKPKRVSRIFVVLFIFSTVMNAVLAFGYGYNQLITNRIRSTYESSVNSALAQTARYKQERDDAQASVAQKNEQLANLNAELSEKTKHLTEVEAQLDATNAKIKSQEAQLAANSTELNQLRGRPPLFSFQTTTARDVSTDVADVKTVVSAAYDTIAQVYGSPYILHQITINFVDPGDLDIPGASAQITITNSSQGLTMEVKLPTFDKDSYENVNTIVHEIIHGFHGLAALNAPVMEEGITVAATDAVMSKLYTQGIIPYNQSFVTLTAAQAAQLNTSLPVPSATSSFYQTANVGTYYNLAGWTWEQLYGADAQFFTKFNEALYAKAVAGVSLTPAVVRDIIAQITSTVNGQTVSAFIAQQITLNPKTS